ncbi:NADPH oxidase 3 [Chelonia mydas]|uniref:NADPH oxidase 3 n=1 Tax=Chelonia mydas TaxID=8469 RepID=M7BLI1_CHEMY|nr:NADPH oxidase 3 [Chelonia mydas]
MKGSINFLKREVIHIVAHLLNIERYHISQSKEAGGLRNKLSGIGKTPNESYLNPIRNYEVAWKWVLGPVVVYICERIVRFWRFQQKVVITKIPYHGKHGAHSAQLTVTAAVVSWVLLSVDGAVRLLTIIIHRFHCNSALLLLLAVDGPFGAATTDVFHYRATHIALHEDEKMDVITGLRQKTFYGRPNWDTEFRQIAENHPSKSIGVFFCGPKALAKILQKRCNLYSSADPRGVQFHYNKESF